MVRAVRVLMALLVLCALAGCPNGPGTADPAARPDAGSPGAGGPRTVILMIGDGMGRGQIAAASRYAHGRPGALAMASLPAHGDVSTASLSGITDSAAAATMMATGEKTFNGSIGVDENEQPVETIVEWANARGFATGLVSTAALPHATPGAFSAHRDSRHDLTAIAEDQIRVTHPDVMLGGGAQYFRPAGEGSVRSDDGLLGEIAAAGYQLVETRDELAAVDAAGTSRVWGMFADEHMTFSRERPAGTAEPTLTEMSLRAIELLDQDPDGFFLMIEGARIDMASHNNDLANTVGETLAFDEAVAAVRDWAAGRDDVLLVVTADHECGGLALESDGALGVMPEVSWRWGQHTNARVDIFAQGPGSDRFDGKVIDHAQLHAAMIAHLDHAAMVEPPERITPDGRLSDLRHAVAMQTAATEFGAGYNELHRLRADADRRGLSIGVEGVFQWKRNAVVILIDRDFGAGTGVRDVAASLDDSDGVADAILTSLPVIAPVGFGAELAAVSWGGQEARIEDLVDDVGWRGLVPPLGKVGNLGWQSGVWTFGEDVRAVDGPVSGTSDEGFEAFVPWSALYPELGGSVPRGAVVGLAVVLVNDDGGYLSNQALPPFPAGTPNPGRTKAALPGVVSFAVDANRDGVGDGTSAPAVVAVP